MKTLGPYVLGFVASLTGAWSWHHRETSRHQLENVEPKVAVGKGFATPDMTPSPLPEELRRRPAVADADSSFAEVNLFPKIDESITDAELIDRVKSDHVIRTGLLTRAGFLFYQDYPPSYQEWVKTYAAESDQYAEPDTNFYTQIRFEYQGRSYTLNLWMPQFRMVEQIPIADLEYLIVNTRATITSGNEKLNYDTQKNRLVFNDKTKTMYVAIETGACEGTVGQYLQTVLVPVPRQKNRKDVLVLGQHGRPPLTRVAAADWQKTDDNVMQGFADMDENSLECN